LSFQFIINGKENVKQYNLTIDMSENNRHQSKPKQNNNKKTEEVKEEEQPKIQERVEERAEEKGGK
jgi:uncharacterized ferredoxin-like protein